MDAMAGSALEELDRGDCLALMATQPVGRIAISVGALPVILPVNFILVDGEVVFRTIPGTKLDAAAAGSVVAFEVDSYVADGMGGWSVLVQGRCSEITNPERLASLQPLPLRAWAYRDGAAQRFVKIETTIVSGRRFRLPA